MEVKNPSGSTGKQGLCFMGHLTSAKATASRVLITEANEGVRITNSTSGARLSLAAAHPV